MSMIILKKLKNILYPRFGEAELITLFYLVLLICIEYRSSILSFYIRIFETTTNLIDMFKLSAGLIVTAVSIFFFIRGLVINSVKNRKVTTLERKRYSFLFYVILSTVSYISLMLNISPISAGTLWSKMEVFFLLFFMLKSFIALIILFISSKMEMDIVSDQMTDVQIGKIELILLLIVSTFLYLVLHKNHPVPVAFSLSYFYTTTFLLFYRNLVNKNIILH